MSIRGTATRGLLHMGQCQSISCVRGGVTVAKQWAGCCVKYLCDSDDIGMAICWYWKRSL